MRHLFVFSAFLLASFTAVAGAEAAPRLLSSAQSWDAYVAEEGGRRLCYAISSPTKADRPGGFSRGPAYFLLTWRRGGAFEPSLIEGGAFMSGSSVKVLIGEQRFAMFTQADGAWVRDAGDERRLAEAMKSGVSMAVQGTIGSGIAVVDQYSLRGLSAALTAAEQACR